MYLFKTKIMEQEQTVTIESKTLWEGMVTIKSYQREDIIAKKQTLVIVHNGKKMTLPKVHVKTKIKKKGPLTPSKKGLQDYHLYYYKWNPDINQD
mgnify:CR=1 FL=1